MTDQHEPERRTVDASRAAGDEPTRELTTTDPDGAAPQDEPTRQLTAPAPDGAAGDEPAADAQTPEAVVPAAEAPAEAVDPGPAPAPDEPAGTDPVGTPGTSPDPVIPAEPDAPAAAPATGARARLTSAGALIWVLLALFGFTLVVQLRSNSADEGLSAARQEDLVRILSDLESRDDRLRAEITTLEQSQRQLSSGVAGRQAALAEAAKRADELGLLAGTEPGRGPGLVVRIDPRGRVKASAVLNAVQELRGAGGEVMQISGSDGTAVRIVASTYFIDGDAGTILVDGARLIGPYTVLVIGPAQTMQTALQIPGGVVASVETAGGSVTMQARNTVEVTALRQPASLRYARPVS
jgi:uncharacterized protein YlxW (UPF0749 family)